MNREQWEKAKEVFEGAILLDEEERTAYVHKACGPDGAILAEIESLLAEYERASSFLAPASGGEDQSNGSTAHPAMFADGQFIADRFRVVRFIGAGGMGEVYEAFDERLEKPVALKVIRAGLVSDSTMERLKREVCLAHQISHTNVCRVFDLEQHFCKEPGKPVVFLTMELLEGETLRSRLQQRAPMALDEALPIIKQMAQALAAFHVQDIVHRDLKPSNVMLVLDKEEGTRAVITDLGVACPAGDTGRIRYNISRDLTGKGQIVGTLDYMAPEQLTSDEITAATDVYAMGLIMYEMVVGKKPFVGENAVAAVCKRFKGPPSYPFVHPAEIGPDLGSLILSCLAVSPTERPCDGRVLLDAIEDRRVNPRQPLKSGTLSTATGSFIAVLPFASKDGDREDEYFSSGLTEELTLLLTKVEGLRVIAPSSARRLQEGDMRDIFRELKVQAVIGGTVRRRGETLRITVQLVNAGGECLWAERYDRQMQDVFSVQEEIAASIARQLQMQLRVEQGAQFVQRRTKNIEAYNLFLKGRFFANRRTSSNLEKAREHFKLALRHDPQFVPALASLADCCVIQGVYGTHPPQEVFPLAKETVFKALTLAPQTAEAHGSAGCIQAIYDWDWTAAQRSFERALELDPNYATAHHSYALYCLLPQGRFSEARGQMQRALAIDPLSLAINASLAVLAYFERRYDDAIRQCTEIVEMDPNFGMAYFFLGQAYEQKGAYPEAEAALERAVALTERSPEALAWLGRTWALAGDHDKAQALLEEMNRLALTQYISPVLFAELFLGLHEIEAALDYLERASALRAADLIWIGVRPAFDGLRAEGRFHKICNKIGLH